MRPSGYVESRGLFGSLRDFPVIEIEKAPGWIFAHSLQMRILLWRFLRPH